MLIRNVSVERLREIEWIWRTRRDGSLFSGVEDFVWNWENKAADIESGAMMLTELRCDEMPQGQLLYRRKIESPDWTMEIRCFMWNTLKTPHGTSRAMLPEYLSTLEWETY
jgi:hypothetical protein